ncbi:MAG: hypothetical protein GX228_00555 [Firmicutes bacterium]|nr:hypothetical protein [Bacillota bacterium]NLL87407.1 hypothetical protein [Bacillota bacterium]
MNRFLPNRAEILKKHKAYLCSVFVSVVLVSILALPQPAVGQASTEFIDTAYIREQINKYESAKSSIDRWEIDAEVQTRVKYLCDLMRKKYQGISAGIWFLIRYLLNWKVEFPPPVSYP